MYCITWWPFDGLNKISFLDSVGSVAEQGPGLVFEVYPEAIATLPGSQIWSCLFFVTMIMLGMDSAVSNLTQHAQFYRFEYPAKNIFELK